MRQNSKIDKRFKLTDSDRELIIQLNEERRRLQAELKKVQIGAIAKTFEVTTQTIYEVLGGHDDKVRTAK